MIDAPIDVRPARPGDEAPVVELLEAEDLESLFVPDEFLVAEANGEVLGCARLNPLSEGISELASVAVDPARRGEGIGRRLVTQALDGAEGPVQALAVEPGFFATFGFEPTDDPHALLEAKAATCCADRDETAMEWRPDE